MFDWTGWDTRGLLQLSPEFNLDARSDCVYSRLEE